MADIGNIEQQLIEQIFKYREALKTRQYLSVNEREQDRIQLNNLYQQLNSVKQKILDSKCYLQLGEIQKELAMLLLADETTSTQRMQMLSYILRCVCHPIIFIHGRSLVERHGRVITTNTVDHLTTDIEEQPTIENFTSNFHTQPLSSQDIINIKNSLKDITTTTEITTPVAQKITWDQAEILSQLAANKEISIVVETIKEQDTDFPLTVIVKESHLK